MKERRRCQRIHRPNNLRARVHSGEPARVLDLSPHGALVETEIALRPGSVCDMALTLSGSGIHVRCVIRRCRIVPNDQGNGTAYRAGMEFLTPTRTQQKPLEDLIEQLCLRPFEVTAAGGDAAA